eukprot:748753_1
MEFNFRQFLFEQNQAEKLKAITNDVSALREICPRLTDLNGVCHSTSDGHVIDTYLLKGKYTLILAEESGKAELHLFRSGGKNTVETFGFPVSMSALDTSCLRMAVLDSASQQ